MSEVAVPVMSEHDARRLTERIRLTAHNYAEAKAKLLELVQEAKEGRAHVALGYSSWTFYLSETLGDEPMRLARDDRQDMVRALANEGMSTRAIAPIVGASVGTVHADRQVFNSEHLDADPVTIDTATGEVLDPRKVTGLDGKTYTRPESVEPPKPKRRALTDSATDAGWDIRKAAEKLQRIFEDDRLSRNKDEVATILRGHLMFTVEVCQDLLDQINE